jgi:hypothetical protein
VHLHPPKTRHNEGANLSDPLPNVLLVHDNHDWGYEIRRPEVWHERPLDVDDGQGLIFTPDPEDTSTALSVEVRDLGTEVTSDDLPDLVQAFLAGLDAVSGSYVEQHQAFANEFAIGIEAVQTYDSPEGPNGQRRKRWVKLLYKGSVQARVIAQAANIEEYDRLRPLFAPCMTTFMLHSRWSPPNPKAT